MTWTPHVRVLKEKIGSYASIFRLLSSNAGGCSVNALLRMYTALCEGLLRYSLPALHGISQTNIQALTGAQAKVLRVCLGLPKSTSTIGTLAESRRLSAPVLLQQEFLRVHLRYATRVPGHPLASDSGPVVRSLLPLHYQSASVPADPSWKVPSWSIVTFVPGFNNKRRTPGPALTYFTLQHMENSYKAHRHIYTDGSVTPTSSAIGVWIPSANVTISATLSHRTSSTATELAALRAAFNYIVDQTAESWVIFTDSRSALQSLKSPSTQEQLVMDIKRLCTKACELNHRIVLQWIPAHCGIQGNVQADDAAKAGHDASREMVEIPFSRKDAAALVSAHAWRFQRSLWTDASHQYGPLYKIDPSCDFDMPRDLNRQEEACLHRIRLNVAYTNYFKNKIKLSDSPLCVPCNVSEDLKHVLCECRRYVSERRSLKAALHLQRNSCLELRHILGPWQSSACALRATKALLTFLRATRLAETL